ncbi:hypothetical protein ACWFPY_14215 [Nocardia fluminea]
MTFSDDITHTRSPRSISFSRANRRQINAEFKRNQDDLINNPARMHVDDLAKDIGLTFDELQKSKNYKNKLRDIANSRFTVSRPDTGNMGSRRALRDMLQHGENEEIRKVGTAAEAYMEYRDKGPTKNRVSEKLGLDVARRYLQRMGADILPLQQDGEGTLDLVAVYRGRLIVIEAKGGASNLRWALAQDDAGDWHWVQQGSLRYLRYKLREHAEILEVLKTYKNGKYRRLAEKLARNRAAVEYSKIQARHRVDAAGNRVLGDVTIERFYLGRNRTGLVAPPPPGSTHKPGTYLAGVGWAPKMLDADKKAAESRRKKLVVGRGTGRLQPGATVSAALAMGGLGVAAVGGAAAAAKGRLPQPNPETISVAAVTPLTGQSPSEGSDPPPDSAQPSDSSQFGNGILSGLKSTIAEFSRMATAFASYVQNGLNELVVMVGGAVSAVSGFVSDVIDSAGVQAVIDKVSDDWAFAQELLNIAMLFSPVGTVAAAISAAVPIIQLIVEHWDQIRAAFDWVLKNVLTPVAEFFITAFKIYIAPYRLAFDAVMAGFNGMGGVVGTAVGAVRSTVVGIVKAIGQIFQRLEINIGFPVNKSFGLKSIGDAMVAWASERLADGGLVGGQRGPAPRRASGIEVMAVIDRSVLRAAQAEERKIGYAYRPPFLHDGALPRTDSGPGPRTFDVRVADVDAAFAQIRMLQAVQDARFSPVGV